MWNHKLAIRNSTECIGSTEWNKFGVQRVNIIYMDYELLICYNILS